MEKLQTFKNNEIGEIRTVVIKGEPYFVGKDVAEILGYAKARNAIAAHVDEDDALKQGVPDSHGIIQETTLINESGLYSLILSSKLPKAKKFKKWVTSEVLPSIRKSGGYVNDDELFINTYLPFADEQTKMLFKSTLETVKKLNEKIEEDKPMVLFAQSVDASQTSILIGDLAKLIKQNGFDIGQNRLFGWLRDNGYLGKHGDRKNMPTQRAMDLKLFEVKERTVANADGSIRITKTPKVTGKGQIYFINKFLSDKEDFR